MCLSILQLEKAAKQSTSKAKDTIEKMLLYNIRITTHVIYGKIKDTLLNMVRFSVHTPQTITSWMWGWIEVVGCLDRMSNSTHFIQLYRLTSWIWPWLSVVHAAEVLSKGKCKGAAFVSIPDSDALPTTASSWDPSALSSSTMPLCQCQWSVIISWPANAREDLLLPESWVKACRVVSLRSMKQSKL